MARLSVLPDPKLQPSSPGSTLPPSSVPHKYCSHNFRKLKGKNKGSHGASSFQYHLLHSPKPAQEKLTPSCPEPLVTLNPFHSFWTLSHDSPPPSRQFYYLNPINR